MSIVSLALENMLRASTRTRGYLPLQSTRSNNIL